MSKVALITDTHWGARGDSIIFGDYISKFYSEQFFPYLIENDIKHVIHLGDALDRRKFVNFVTAKRFKEDFIIPLDENNIDAYFIIGNHDTYFKNTNEVNCMNVLFGRNVKSYDKPDRITIDGTDIVLMPWICSGNYDECMEYISNTKAQILFGHLDISGFQMYKGIASAHEGLDRNIFSKFDLVCSGHFHHKSHEDNIHYLGAPYEMTWSDYNDPRGFHIFDTNTRDLTFIQNTFTMFTKVFYDDSDREKQNQMDDYNFDSIKNKYVKVVVKNKVNVHLFDLFIDRLNAVGPAHMQVVEDNLNLDLDDDTEIINEAEDTITIIKKYIDALQIKNQKTVENLFMDLYHEALSTE